MNPTHPPIPALLPGPFEWCAIPAGSVLLAAGGDVPEGGQSATVAPFFMAKYAISNAQFEVFATAPDGYADPKWWDYSENAAIWRLDSKHAYPTAFGGDTMPRTEVNWYEAMAFGRWLSHHAGYPITLPTEAQWQFAAQGSDGRAYPWGDADPTPDLLNGAETLGHPAPIDAYPAGASPFGVLNMAGNVWEWCLTGWQTGADDDGAFESRVVRGGSWYHACDDAAKSLRRDFNPYLRAYYIGLRVACGPVIVKAD